LIKKELSEKQKSVLDYIVNYSQENGFPPTKKEISQHFNQNNLTMTCRHLEALEKKGFIKVLKRVARGIQVIKPCDFYVPMVGVIAAGMGLLAEQNIIGKFDPIANRDVPKESFGLTVKGDSMIEAGIFSGDTVIINPLVKPSDGDIGAIIVDGDATIKYIFYNKDTVILKPANKTMSDIVIKTGQQDINIVGSVVAVWRKMKSKRKKISR